MDLGRSSWQSRTSAQLTSFSVVASCGLLPRTTRPGPRLWTAFWSVASLRCKTRHMTRFSGLPRGDIQRVECCRANRPQPVVGSNRERRVKGVLHRKLASPHPREMNGLSDPGDQVVAPEWREAGG